MLMCSKDIPPFFRQAGVEGSADPHFDDIVEAFPYLQPNSPAVPNRAQPLSPSKPSALNSNTISHPDIFTMPPLPSMNPFSLFSNPNTALLSPFRVVDSLNGISTSAVNVDRSRLPAFDSASSDSVLSAQLQYLLARLPLDQVSLRNDLQISELSDATSANPFSILQSAQPETPYQVHSKWLRGEGFDTSQFKGNRASINPIHDLTDSLDGVGYAANTSINHSNSAAVNSTDAAHGQNVGSNLSTVPQSSLQFGDMKLEISSDYFNSSQPTQVEMPELAVQPSPKPAIELLPSQTDILISMISERFPLRRLREILVGAGGAQFLPCLRPPVAPSSQHANSEPQSIVDHEVYLKQLLKFFQDWRWTLFLSVDQLTRSSQTYFNDVFTFCWSRLLSARKIRQRTTASIEQLLAERERLSSKARDLASLARFLRAQISTAPESEGALSNIIQSTAAPVAVAEDGVVALASLAKTLHSCAEELSCSKELLEALESARRQFEALPSSVISSMV
jgi:hypothetical protein